MLDACKIRNLGKKIKIGDLEQQLIKGMDFNIEKGEFVVIVGPSGAGKSTILNILGGLDRASQGEIECAGYSLSKCNNKKMTEYRQKIGFVFQDYALIENLTVAENVELMSVITKKKVDISSILRKVGLQNHTNKLPEILFCDEPTGALDEKNGKNVLAILQELNQTGTTVVVVTHLLGMQAMANHVIRIVDGRIKEEIMNEHVISAKEVAWA